MAKRILTDMNVMQPVAWCDWQYMSGGFGGVWCLVGYNGSNQTFERTKGYYCRKQFSKYIKPGYTIVSNNNENILSAVSADNKELVLVIVNQDSVEKKFSVELPAKTVINDKISCVRTSEDEECSQLAAPQIKVIGSTFNVMSKPKSITTLIVQLK
jgi:O-glycosyl hydrolase